MKSVKQNVVVNTTGRACLSDIGFPAFAHDEESETGGTGSSTHGSRWTASEVLGNGEFSKQSDVFSFGFVAAEVHSKKSHFLWPLLTIPRSSQGT